MAHAADRTAINCHKMDCRWNDHGECAAATILVDDGPVCLTYEPMPGMAPMPGAGMTPAGLGPPPVAPPMAPAGAAAPNGGNPLAALILGGMARRSPPVM